ncbi:hypothetical protein [Flavobacterium gawalongense]|uniref:Uncharacterized protein n=1 Tax=Flavobacterium gawalongense TaxID=2594432 RepID=A0A553BK15_9FLAO|nr:hypothetical protein [Flavobacterium gawalongense]TRX00353.1 hypothetical protein FNW33_12295 [Flavobacterium gawalongense]TRX08410.1 hypothetical protein FNW12_03985 [Flavobacterium gawalongense]TRX08593.1 hypothetical protein FNW11_11095 [Flavobacterium gawalongense]TRX09576.1 hypothetical protein FNW10_10980 [Flavobacterium gawalongense]TRX25585.1 hypothetical protein FNW38_10955 [Flavobacterium gawalongense]
MLNKSIRDEENIRIDNVLKTLLSLVFVPKFWNLEDIALIENELKDLGMNIQSLRDFGEKDLITHLQRCHLDWNQLEQFADFLVAFSKDEQFDFTEKAIAFYNYIQQESKMFSFGINSKIAAAKAKL